MSLICNEPYVPTIVVSFTPVIVEPLILRDVEMSPVSFVNRAPNTAIILSSFAEDTSATATGAVITGASVVPLIVMVKVEEDEPAALLDV